MDSEKTTEERLALLEKKFRNLIDIIMDSETIHITTDSNGITICPSSDIPSWPIQGWEMDIKLDEDK